MPEAYGVVEPLFWVDCVELPSVLVELAPLLVLLELGVVVAPVDWSAVLVVPVALVVPEAEPVAVPLAVPEALMLPLADVVSFVLVAVVSVLELRVSRPHPANVSATAASAATDASLI